VLNANYIRKGLEGATIALFHANHARSCFSDKLQAKKGVRTWTSPSVSSTTASILYTAFPLIVPGSADDRADEDESKEEMEFIIEAMKSIAEEVEEDPQTVIDHRTPREFRGWTETAAARKTRPRWKPVL